MPGLQQLFGEVAGAERFGGDQRTLIGDGRLARRRCQSSTAPRTINASRKGTRMGASEAASERAARAVSSRNERGGPNRTTFATGPPLSFLEDTASAALSLAATLAPILVPFQERE